MDNRLRRLSNFDVKAYFGNPYRLPACAVERALIIVVGKKKLWTAAIALLVLAAIAAISVAAAYAYSPGIRKVIVIDAGHGGADGGVTGVNTGVTEAEINLTVARLVETELKALGYETVLTRDDEGEAGVFAENDEAALYNKREEMQRRRDIISAADPLCVISIHCNNFPSPSRRGAQVFYSAGSSGGKALAAIVQSALNKLNTEKTGRTYSALGGDYYILNCTAYPSAIVECGFLSNPEDEKLLTDDGYRALLAVTIARAVNEYVSSSLK